MKHKAEHFKETNIDGETIIMTIDGSVIRFGNRFEENCKIHVGAFDWQKRRNTREAFEFFRHYAPLFSRKELPAVLECYRRAARQTLDSTRAAFWKFWDGARLQTTGKATFKYVKT